MRRYPVASVVAVEGAFARNVTNAKIRLRRVRSCWGKGIAGRPFLGCGRAPVYNLLGSGWGVWAWHAVWMVRNRPGSFSSRIAVLSQSVRVSSVGRKWSCVAVMSGHRAGLQNWEIPSPIRLRLIGRCGVVRRMCEWRMPTGAAIVAIAIRLLRGWSGGRAPGCGIIRLARCWRAGCQDVMQARKVLGLRAILWMLCGGLVAVGVRMSLVGGSRCVGEGRLQMVSRAGLQRARKLDDRAAVHSIRVQMVAGLSVMVRKGPWRLGGGGGKHARGYVGGGGWVQKGGRRLRANGHGQDGAVSGGPVRRAGVSVMKRQGAAAAWESGPVGRAAANSEVQKDGRARDGSVRWARFEVPERREVGSSSSRRSRSWW